MEKVNFEGNEFEKLWKLKKIQLINLAFGNEFQKSKSRSILWRLCLGILPAESEDSVIRDALIKSRKIYQDIITKDPLLETQSEDPNTCNPLALENPNNPWAKIAEESKVKELISRDIERTNQGISFFKKKETKDNLIEILYWWATQNPKIHYRQGMNEIAAIIYYVLENDYSQNQNPNDLYRELISNKFIKHDCFILFDALMKSGVAHLYEISEEKSSVKSLELFGWDDEEPSSLTIKSCLEMRVFRIMINMVKFWDKQLYTHLKSLNVIPQTFLTRWIKCFLSREFPLDLTCQLWDCVFAVGNFNLSKEFRISLKSLANMPNDPLIFLDILCASMIIYLKNRLISSDYSKALELLFKYPQQEGIKNILEIAHELFNKIVKSTIVLPSPLEIMKKAIKEKLEKKEKNDYDIKDLKIYKDKDKMNKSDNNENMNITPKKIQEIEPSLARPLDVKQYSTTNSNKNISKTCIEKLGYCKEILKGENFTKQDLETLEAYLTNIEDLLNKIE